MADSDSGGNTVGMVLRVRLFGPASFAIGARELRFKSLKLRAALGYIALSESQTETRERLVGMLWSESGEDHARASLRQNIRELRVALEGSNYSGLYIAGHEIGFETGTIVLDVLTVMEAAEAGQVHPLLLERRNLADELLAGLEDLDPSFRSWLLAKRHTVRDRLLRALENAIADDPGDLAREGKLAQAILNLDPTHEDAARRLMRTRALSGDTAGALRVYKTLWDLLDEDYGMEPAEATQKLVADIKTGVFEAPRNEPNPPVAVPVRAAAPIARRATQLWLSVEKISIREIDPAKAHLVLEFRQHLIASLVRFREWQVTDAPVRPPAGEEASSLAGHYEVQMNAHQAGPNVHMMITLKDLEPGLYIWNENFELRLENWFDFQRHVIRRIAMGLNVHLSADRLRRLSNSPDVSLGLYDRWLRCQTQIRTFNPQFWRRLKEQFAAIIDEAPEFGAAYGGLADLNNLEHIAHPGVFRTPERTRTALAYAREAVRLDPLHMAAHKCLAWSHSMLQQFDQAIMHIEVAQELNPNDSWNAISGAGLLALYGMHERASELAAMAMDMTLAPSLAHWAYQATIDCMRGDYEATIRAADMSQNVIWYVPALRTAALAMLDRTTEAEAEADRFIARIRLNWYGEQPATREAIMKWLLHIHPIRRREDWARFRDGLARAGLPTDSAEHGVW
jgi:DNA-binding SARP family transcriptional activator/TolB-like protein